MEQRSKVYLVSVLRHVLIELVRRMGPDLSARQLGVFLVCYLQDDPQTVRGLAVNLMISKPAVTRVLDRLTDLKLARRKVDVLDKRSVFVERTREGANLLHDIKLMIQEGEARTRDKDYEDDT